MNIHVLLVCCAVAPVLWPVSSYVATLVRRRAPASIAATGPLASLVGADALALVLAPCWLVSLTDVCTPALHCKGQSDS